jgi:hypothetical protein
MAGPQEPSCYVIENGSFIFGKAGGEDNLLKNNALSHLPFIV